MSFTDPSRDSIGRVDGHVQGDLELLLADATGGRDRQLLQLPDAEAGVGGADDRRAVLRVRVHEEAHGRGSGSCCATVDTRRGSRAKKSLGGGARNRDRGIV